MTDTSNILWQTKVHARLHDPAEKALVLLRDPAGHEGGNSRVLWRLARHDVLPAEAPIDNDNADVLHAVAFSDGIKPATWRVVQRADWWAAAADRPQWPMQEITVQTRSGEEKTFGVAHWAQVNWAKKPVLIHPLTGEQYDLGNHGGLSESNFQEIKGRTFTHQSQLLIRNGGVTDFQKTLLALWRFAPEVDEPDDNDKLGPLWRLLPADTRIPDHSIWDHLDLTSAFAGAFAADPAGEAALLTLAIGPVQPFIASARKMDDLWAGSHLLSRLSWEAMRVVCEQLGPDAILFPRLRGVPQVDLWLRDQMQLPDELFNTCDWHKGTTDANPLFAAALPNRFVAVVPASQAKAIAEAVQAAVRAWLQTLGQDVVIALLNEAGYAGEEENIPTPFEQMKEQLAGFPEVHWAIVPFSLIGIGNPNRQTELDATQLSAAMKPFFVGDGEPGFLGSNAWKLLQKEAEWVDENGKKQIFFAPNPGVLYPAVYELAERALAATKALRPFQQSKHEGWRCTLSGESEWLTTDRQHLKLPAGQREQTLWTKVAAKRPAWAKRGEHLGGLAAIKRLWPTLFAEEVGRALSSQDGNSERIDRFVVSTHTMALAHQLAQHAQSSGDKPLDEKTQAELKSHDRVALPPKLARQLYRHEQGQLLARVPGWLDEARESENEGVLKRTQDAITQLLGQKPETYYGLLLMDGDNMGKWLAGSEDHAIDYRSSFHPQVRAGFDKVADKHAIIKQYGKQARALSPNRHLAISGALNDFSLNVVRHVVETEHLGRLIYAGGDDVFAMLPVADLLPAMQRLRHAYSGHDPEHQGGHTQHGLNLHQGFALLNGKLMRMMGTRATASCGAVIAHHQAPLAAVRRELAAAEQRAKNKGGRDAFSITVIKRSGGALRLTAKWGQPLRLLDKLRTYFATEGVSRRAAYHILQWLDDHTLPQPEGDGAMLQALLTYQLARQAKGEAKKQAEPLASQLTALTLAQPPEQRINWLRNFVSVAEFLAREVRTTAGASS